MAEILAVVDPAGNSGGKEGWGETGIAVFHDGKLVDFISISSQEYPSTEYYWFALWEVIKDSNVIVCENYRLFAHKANQQAGSELETPQLIGFLRMQSWLLDIPFKFQRPADKARFSDEVLTSMGVFELRGNKHYCLNRSTNLHMRDAIRHGYFYLKYGKGK